MVLSPEAEVFMKLLKRFDKKHDQNGIFDSIDRHLLNSFNKLADIDKIDVIMGRCRLCYSELSANDIVTQTEPQLELCDIDATNKVEMIKLKTWLAKAGAVALVIGMVTFTGIVLYLSKTSTTDSKDGVSMSYLDLAGKVLKVIFID